MIYVMSDIHGFYNRYKSIMRQIKLKKDDHLYVLGDCIDRFPDGLAILKELFYKPNVTVLLGNHEHMMLEALTKTPTNHDAVWMWYRNGGDITHDRLKRCTKAYRAEMIEIIRQLPINVEVRCNDIDYLLVHGAPLGYRQRHDDPIIDAVWTRLDRFSVMPPGKTVIFGHTPTDHYQYRRPMSIYHGKNMIGIDCGCAYRDVGRLACLRLDDMKEFYSESDWQPTDDDEFEALKVLLNSKE